MFTHTDVYFAWSPPANGHRWVSARPVNDNWSLENAETLVLTARGVPPGWEFHGKEGGFYEPLEAATGLFLELARTDPVPDAIVAFADRYGPLTSCRLFVPLDAKAKLPKPPPNCSLANHRLLPESEAGVVAGNWAGMWIVRGAVFGDSLKAWQDNIRAMKSLVALWEALRKNNRKSIEKYTKFEKNGQHRSLLVVDDAGAPVNEPLSFTPDSKITLQWAAEHALLGAITKRFSDGASVSLSPAESRDRSKLAIIPRSLEAAIWIQFGLAVVETKTHRNCDVCGRPFEVSPQVARTNRTLCSSACKAKAHRQRRDRALKLAAQGLKPRQIASRVGSQLSTVQKWLKTEKGDEYWPENDAETVKARSTSGPTVRGVPRSASATTARASGSAARCSARPSKRFRTNCGSWRTTSPTAATSNPSGSSSASTWTVG